MVRLLTFCLLLLSCSQLSAQLHFKLDFLPGGLRYGVFVRPCGEVYPTANTITGSGQATIVFPVGLSLTEFTNHAGTWTINATVAGPVEAPGMVYISVGFVTDYPKMDFNHDAETLLFSFAMSGNVGGVPYLMDNLQDPFNQLPNSISTNPGNELSVIDLGTSPVTYYSYSGNYAGIEPGCDDKNPLDTTDVNPQDTVIVNQPDTTTVDTIQTDPDTTTLSGIPVIEAERTIFVVFPNPASDWVQVKFIDKRWIEKGHFQLWSMEGLFLGRLQKGSDDVYTIHIGALPSGLYLISYEASGRIMQQERFLKR